MSAISIFEIFKIGVGPSSSHTIGPWRAALDFLARLHQEPVDYVEVYLYGSLSKTGKGHATDAAVQLGLLGYDPETVDTSLIQGYLQELSSRKSITCGPHEVVFDPGIHVVFTDRSHKSHPNTLEFIAYRDAKEVLRKAYASVGGGFIRKVGDRKRERVKAMPYPAATGAELLAHLDRTGLHIAGLSLRNELSRRSLAEINRRSDLIVETMIASVYRGCITEGILPGGLNVKRRARAICTELLAGKKFRTRDEWEHHIFHSAQDFNTVNKWVSCFALAVNEENASMGRIVTSPTNGAAGVIPAVLLYYRYFCPTVATFDPGAFLRTAGEIGILFKKGATISAAVGGCQAEIGVSSAMAAAGLTEVLGGTPRQALMAAEIAMEHHLGLTCDPVGGLVQIPCIERNAMGAMKAITAANLALSGDPAHSKVDIDMVIQTMWETAKSMNKRFKETSEGGLAIALPVIQPEC